MVTVFDLASPRDRFMQPLLEQLRRQGSAERRPRSSTSTACVKVPGRLSARARHDVSDLVRAGGGYAEAAYVEQAELTRYAVVNGERRETEVRHDRPAPRRVGRP